MNRLVLLMRLWLCGGWAATLGVSAAGGLTVAHSGAPIVDPGDPYALGVVVTVENGVTINDLRITNQWPAALFLNGYQAPAGTVFIPRGADGVWRLGNITGPASLTLNLYFPGRPEGEVYRFRSDAGDAAAVSTNSPSDTVRSSVLFQNQDDCEGIPGIVARWRGEGNAIDNVGGHDGQLANFPAHGYFTNGQSCRGFYFDGAGGGVFVPRDPRIEPTVDERLRNPALEFAEDEDLAFSAWINMDLDQPNGNSVIIDKRESFLRPDFDYTAVGYLFSLFRQGTKETGKWVLECQLSQQPIGGTVTNHHSTLGPDLRDGRWHHVAVSVQRKIKDGGRFFIDGNPAGSFDPLPYRGDLRPTPARPLQIGLHAVNGFPAQFKGRMDDVTIYRRALTDVELRQIHQDGLNHECCRNIAVSLSVTNEPVSLGVPFDLFARVTRTPGRPPGDLLITNLIPAGMTALQAIPQLGLGSATNFGNYVVWNLGTLGADDTASLRMRLVATNLSTNLVVVSRVSYSGPPDDDASDDLATAVVQSTGTPKCEPLSGLLGWWTGNLSTQDIVSTNRGVPTGSVEYTNGIVSSGFAFDGKSGVLGVGNPAGFHVQDLTIEAWVRRGDSQKATAAGTGGFLFAGDTGGYGFGLLDDGRLMLSQVGLSFVASSRGVTETTNWHHVAVTKSGTNVVFYLDGSAITTTNLAGKFVFNRPFALGGLNAPVRNIFWGDVDDLSLYSRPLSSVEIEGIVDAGSRGKCRTGLAIDEKSENVGPCELKYVIETDQGINLVFLTLPNAVLNLEASTNLVDWVSVPRIANAGGEVRDLIRTNQTLFYRCRGGVGN